MDLEKWEREKRKWGKKQERRKRKREEKKRMRDWGKRVREEIGRREIKPGEGREKQSVRVEKSEK